MKTDIFLKYFHNNDYRQNRIPEFPQDAAMKPLEPEDLKYKSPYKNSIQFDKAMGCKGNLDAFGGGVSSAQELVSSDKKNNRINRHSLDTGIMDCANVEDLMKKDLMGDSSQKPYLKSLADPKKGPTESRRKNSKNILDTLKQIPKNVSSTSPSHSICQNFTELLGKMYCEGEKLLDPSGFKAAVAKYNDLFDNNEQQDSHELMNSFLYGMSEEITKDIPKSQKRTPNPNFAVNSLDYQKDWISTGNADF
jgi:hypothetical protein